MKTTFLFPLLIASSLLFTACDEDSDDIVGKAIEQSVSSIIQKHGVPRIINGTDYATALEIYKLRDQSDFGTFTYVFDKREGGFACVARSLGYPMPASVQIANPRKDDGGGVDHYHTLPQAEANGLFMPEGLAATYQRYVGFSDGQPKLGYFEDNLNVYPFELPAQIVKRPCSALYGE